MRVKLLPAAVFTGVYGGCVVINASIQKTTGCLFVNGKLRGSHNVMIWNRMMMGTIHALGALARYYIHPAVRLGRASN